MCIAAVFEPCSPGECPALRSLSEVSEAGVLWTGMDKRKRQRSSDRGGGGAELPAPQVFAGLPLQGSHEDC